MEKKYFVQLKMKIKRKKNKISPFPDPIIAQINRDTDGSLKSILQYIPSEDNPKTKTKKTVLLPCWLIGTFGFLFTGLMIFFCATMYLQSVKRPGLYTESCVGRWCIPGFGLKCISGICDCSSTEFYQKGCQPKLNYSQKCMSNSKLCVDNQNLVCSDGVCKCNSTMFWDGQKCLTKQSYIGSCYNSDDGCVTLAKLICDLNRKLCVCPSDR